MGSKVMADAEAQNGALTVQVRPLPPLDQLELIWRDLEARADPRTSNYGPTSDRRALGGNRDRRAACRD
jgi:hypothetical protein